MMNDELKSFFFDRSSLRIYIATRPERLGTKIQRPSESKDAKWGSQTIYSDFDGKNGTKFQEPNSKNQTRRTRFQEAGWSWNLVLGSWNLLSGPAILGGEPKSPKSRFGQ